MAGYIEYMVEMRNEISHNFKQQSGDQLDKKKMVTLIHFLKILINLIDNYLNSQIINKFKNSLYVKEFLDINTVIKACGVNIEDYCILEVNIPSEGTKIPNCIFLKCENGPMEPIEILEIRCAKIRFRKMVFGKLNSIKVQVGMKVRKGENYTLCFKEPVVNKMSIIRTVYQI